MTHIDIEIEDVLGIEREPADRDVGIFQESFCLVMKDNTGKQIQLDMGEEEFISLIELMTPYVLNRQAELKNQEGEC